MIESGEPVQDISINEGTSIDKIFESLSKSGGFESRNLADGLSVLTEMINNKECIIKSANIFRKPFITKHNRAGKGLGVKLFNNKKELDSYVSGKDFETSIDGITLLQEYIDAKPKIITRVEFVNSKFVYAVEVDASDGFELCPACPEEPEDVPETQFFGEYCPTIGNKFRIIKNFKENEIIKKYEKFIQANGIEIAGIEYIKDKEGIIYTYDVNTNTNYNSQAEK